MHINKKKIFFYIGSKGSRIKKLILGIIILGVCISGFILIRASGECKLLRELALEKGVKKNCLVFILKLSGCSCIADYENLQQWKNLYYSQKNNKEVDFKAFAMQNKDATLQELYGFEFKFKDDACQFKGKSLTIFMNSGKVIFKKVGVLNIDDYYSLKNLLEKDK
jgi:hypothetical protein